MNSRLKRLLSGLIVFGLLITTTVGSEEVKAEPFLENAKIDVVDGEASQENDFYKMIYESIVDGDSSIKVEDGEDKGIRANIVVEDPPPKPKSDKAVRPSYSSNSKGQNIANFARGLVGKAYVFGATGPNAFDCSGLILYIYRQFGIHLPRTSQSQAYYGTRISKSQLSPGDLVFFNTYSSLSHVGVYIGNGQMVHAANTRTGVLISNINDGYYGPRYAWAMRVVK